jgi:hypothetical protein
MQELQKIARVIKKLDPEAPHDTVLILDATTGQNAHAQVEVFQQMVNVSGLIVTKLDGTARGGVLVSLAQKFGLPVHAIGVGESADDMRPFSPEDYARSLMGLNRDEAAPVMEPIAEIPEPVAAPALEPETAVAEPETPAPEAIPTAEHAEPEIAEPAERPSEPETEILELEAEPVELEPEPEAEEKAAPAPEPAAEEQSTKRKRRLFGLRW